MAKRLTPKRINAIRPDDRTRTYGDGRGGNGLTLAVQPNGVRYWYQRLRFEGRDINVGLGGFPAVSLAAARRAAVENRAKALAGINPQGQQRPKQRPIRRADARRQRIADGTATLADCIDAVILEHVEDGDWKNAAKTEQQWRASLRHVEPLTRREVAGIDATEITAELRALAAKHPTTAAAVLSRLGEAGDYAVDESLRPDNPFRSRAVRRRLKAVRRGKGGHHAAMPYAEVADAIQRARAVEHMAPVKALAFELIVLTACRTREVYGARWSEIGGDVWTIPASRMKAKAEHRVPLSPQALDVLRRARELHPDSELVFPSPRTRTELANGTSDEIAVKAAIKPYTMHGFRTSFRTWAMERTDADHAIMELSLAHKVGGSVERAYARSDMLAKRRELMESWGAYLFRDVARR